MRILVTGAAGSVGSTVAHGLKERYQIRGHDRVPMPDLDDTLVSNLDDFDALATAVSGGRIMSRELELPFSDDRRIRSVLGFQLEGKLPADLDDLVYDYTLLEEDDEQARLLCPAVDRQWLADFLADKGAQVEIVTDDIKPGVAMGGVVDGTTSGGPGLVVIQP